MKTLEDKEAMWKARIADYRKSGKSLSEWCSDNQIPKTSMHYYMYYRPKKESKVESKFVEVIVKEERKQAISITIGSAVINVDDNTDLDLLKKIVGAFKYD